eukprot:COSAG02_NODE_2542_length_8571_cov_7.094429_3_plen_93_part_00
MSARISIRYSQTVLYLGTVDCMGADSEMTCCGNAASVTLERVNAMHATPLWIEAVETDEGVALLRRCILAMRAGDAGDGVVRSNVGGEWLQI